MKWTDVRRRKKLPCTSWPVILRYTLFFRREHQQYWLFVFSFFRFATRCLFPLFIRRGERDITDIMFYIEKTGAEEKKDPVVASGFRRSGKGDDERKNRFLISVPLQTEASWLASKASLASA